MADSPRPWTLLLLLFLHTLCLSSASPQNLETFYPSSLPPPPPPPQIPLSPPPPQILVAPATPPPGSPPSGNSNKIAKAVAATAASTLVVTGLAFALFMVAKRRREKTAAASGDVHGGGVDGGGGGGGRPLPLQSRSNFVRYQGDVKGIIVDENGLDVLYWRKLERSRNGDLRKEVLRKKEVVQEVPLLRGRSSSSHVKVLPVDDEDQDHENHEEIYSSNSVQRIQQGRKPNGVVFKPVRDLPELDSPSSRSSTASSSLPPYHEALYSSSSTARQQSRRTNGNTFKAVRESPELDSPSSRSSTASCPPPPSAPSTPPPKPPLPPLLPPAATAFLSVPKKLVPPTPIPAKKTVVPIPAPPPVIRTSNAIAKPPAPPPLPATRSMNAVGRPPPPPPPVPKEKEAEKTPGSVGSSGGDDGRVIMKPLHWDKVNRVNTDHSMVWDKINDGGSFRFDGDLMEALFGYVATNKKSPTGNNKEQSNDQSRSNPSRTYILDTRKSQNIAIILKSLYVSRKEVIDALMEGIGLSQETLEKLSRIAPTPEEQSLILEYDADPARLADAERFLFHVLKAVPSAFTRLNAMLFRATCGSEITQLKDSVQTLELACGELRTRGLFVKLLEAILKSGNRMNAGTSRGNAQAFNLTSLRKLSDVKSTDGKTTLLHFVVEEVIRFEGKRCALNRSRSMNRSSPSSSMKEDKEKEYLTLGLPIVGGLSSEFSNVKKAASVDYDVVSTTCSSLSARAAEIRRMIVSQSVKGGFAKEMESFLDSIEDELRKEDQERARVLDLVIKTTEYYQAGASKDKEAHPFQLFVIVKDFLIMVDQVCVEIARTMQRKTRANGVSGSSANAPTRPEKFAVRFPNLPKNFMSDKSSSDESDDEQ